MSDLQIVLIIIGGIIIAGVLIFNWWQERKFHQQIENNFSAFNHENTSGEPILDTIDLKPDTDKFDDPDFSISERSFEEENTDKIDPIADSVRYFEDETEVISFPELALEADLITTPPAFSDQAPKSATHEGIKAIIEDAFKHEAAKEEESFSASSEQQELVSTQSQSSEPTQASTALPDELHEQVDLVAVLYLQGEAPVRDVAQSLKGGFNGYDKPSFVHIESGSEWMLLSDAASKPEQQDRLVSKISCAIQLADRAGAITRSVLNRFQLAVENLALDVNAQVEWQSTNDALSDANALDQFCIEVDKTMGFHLLHGENGAFTGTKLRGLAEAQGFELSADGIFKYYDVIEKNAVAGLTAATPSFVMFNRDHHPFSADMLRSSVVKSITFQLDIPHVNNAIDAFNQMLQIAKQMETGLNAQLVDDNNRPLGDVQIEKIRHQLKIIQATMLNKGITPGSGCAHRLFS
jgi:FtsZ-interacting cell division protein ZipA